MRKLFYCIACILFSVKLIAQTPGVPSGQPGKMPLPVPKLQPLKPDLVLVSSRVISVVEVESRRLFETTISITLKNQGGASTGTGFTLDLRSRFGTTSGGTDYSMIGAHAAIRVMAPGETRTVEYVFAKDITAMGRARLQCVIRLDSMNSIAESNEENNTSPFFDIVPPRP